MIAVFDTNIVIDALNGVTEADDEYSRYERVLISRVTWMEVLIGADGDDSELRDFLETHFEIIPLDDREEIIESTPLPTDSGDMLEGYFMESYCFVETEQV